MPLNGFSSGRFVSAAFVLAGASSAVLDTFRASEVGFAAFDCRSGFVCAIADAVKTMMSVTTRSRALTASPDPQIRSIRVLPEENKEGNVNASGVIVATD
jgi:hypothetical protein